MGEVVPPIPGHKVVWMLDGMITCLCGEVPPSADERDVRIHIEWALDMRVKELTAALAFYADPDTWRRYDYKPDPAGASWEPAPIESDNQGDRARAALRGGTPWLR